MVMKRSMSMILACVMLCSPFFVSAQIENNELIDVLERLEEQKVNKQVKNLQENLLFETFESCEDLETTLETFIKENFEPQRQGWLKRGMPMPMPMPMIMEDEAAFDMAESADMAAPVSAKVAESGEVVSSTTDFSTTNTQVDGVDEADIIKTDGDYIYYYNARMKKVSIVRSPLDTDTSRITLSDAEELASIRVPRQFHTMHIYIAADKLVLLWQRWSEQQEPWLIDRSSRTDVIVYDIKNPTQPKLEKFSDFDGSYHDSRMIGNTLYVVSQLSMNRWYPYADMEEGDDISIHAKDVLPKAINISATQDSSKHTLTLNGKTYPFSVDIARAWCESIQYVLPSKESMDEFGLYPSFTVVRALDITQSDAPVTTRTAFGNTQIIHVSQSWLYLTSPLYVPYAFSCPIDARCLLPWYDAGQHTLTHKFSLAGKDMNYEASNVVQWSPLSQYSMSEDADGNFRILTTTWNPSLATHFFILDESLNLEGFLLNIEPGEEFKSSRYIGDKLYLVTFEQVDPLFVIDLENTKKPKIIGELKIPGFSTYLHPYASVQDGIQYLIGLWYDTELNQRWWVTTKGVKLDLYEIDYNDKDENGYVGVSQKYTQVYGGKQSQSEALHNPRMFVWDQARKFVVLPMILTKDSNQKRCEIVYDSNGNEVDRECWDDEQYTTTFAWLKAIEIDADVGIKEKYSYDFLEMLKKDDQVYRSWNGQIYPWQFNQLNFRVGYAGDVLYTFNNLFAHFALMWGDAYFVPFDVIMFSDSETDEEGECSYVAPPAGWITCQMYCGERWVAEEWTCVSVEVSAACTCPWFATQRWCEENCL